MYRLLFAFHRALILIEFIVRHIVEWILGIRSLVDSGIVLESSLDDALGGSTHHHHMITGLGDRRVLQSAGLVPCDALQDVRLWSSGDLIRPAIVLDLKGSLSLVTGIFWEIIDLNTDLLLDPLELSRISSGRHKLEWIFYPHWRRVGRRTLSHPLLGLNYICFLILIEKERERNLFLMWWFFFKYSYS